MKNLKKKDRLVNETHTKASEIAGEIFTHLVSYYLDESLYVKKEDNWITSTQLGVDLFDAMEHIIEHELLKQEPKSKPKWKDIDKVLHQGKWYVKYQDII